MNLTRISILALAISACGVASAQWYPNTVAGVSTVPSMSFFDLTSINGVPIVLGGNGTADAYSGGVGTFYCSGTDLNNRAYVKGLHSIGLTTATSYGQSHNISWDGTKVSVGMLQQTFDGSVRGSMARYDIPTDLITPYGNLGYYASSGTPAQASVAHSMSGDGNTIAGQAYWKLANSGTASTTNFVVPTVATPSLIEKLVPLALNNGRVQCVNFDGTAVGGYAVSTSDPMIWRKVAGVWQAGTAPTGNVGTTTGVSFGAPTACDASGRYFFGAYTGALSSPNVVPYRLDTTTGKATLISAPVDPPIVPGNDWRAIVSAVSSYGDIVYGTYQTFPSLIVDLFEGFVWTPTTGMQLMDDFVDAQWPGVRNPALHINNLGNAALSPDGDWATLSTFSSDTTTASSTLALLHMGTPVRGTLTLNDYVGDKTSKTMSWTLLDSSNATVETLTGKLDDLGRWVWLVKTDISTGTWKIQADGGQFLKNTATFNYSTKNSVNLTMVNGDPDYSGEVDAIDIDLVIANFGNTPSSSGWNADVDLDGSDEVDALDIDIAIANFGSLDQ